MPFAKLSRQFAPLRPGAYNPQNSLHEQTGFTPSLAGVAFLSKAKRRYDSPLGGVQNSSGQGCSPVACNLEPQIIPFVNPERQQPLTWHFVSNHVTDILTVGEQAIIDAMKLIWKRMKIVVEPSSAVPRTTILKHKNIFAGKRVGVIITGGNVDLDLLPWLNG